MKPGYTVRGKLEGAGVGDPVNEGQNPDRNGLDLDVIAPDGHELQADEIIALGPDGPAWKAKVELLNKATGEVLAGWEGKGATSERYPEDWSQPGEEGARGMLVPKGGYELNHVGSSALLASNGLRGVINYKQALKGTDGVIVVARASVDGVEARFPGGNERGFGNADKRKQAAVSKGHGS